MSDSWNPSRVDTTRPLMLAYLRAALCKSERELADTRNELADFAYREGYTMGPIFTEHQHKAPAAFHALIDAVKQYDARAIVVPSEQHLAVLGAPPPLTRYVQSVTGIPLFMTRPPASGAERPAVPPRSPRSPP